MAEPMYRRIADDLRCQIEAGDLQPGQQLPAEQALGSTYNASRNTIRDAIKWLTIRGLIETRPGRGTFVVETIVPFVTTLLGDPATGGGEGVYVPEVSASRSESAIRTPRVEIQKATGFIAGALGIEEGAAVVSRHQERFIDGTPWSLQASYYPLDLVSRGAQRLLEASNITEGTIAYLREALGLVQVGYRDTITVRPYNAEEAFFFGLADGLSMTMVECVRTGFAEGGADSSPGIPFRVTVSVNPTGRGGLFGPGLYPTVVDPGRAPAEFVVPA
jgi:GntR family transcriptional regulator